MCLIMNELTSLALAVGRRDDLCDRVRRPWNDLSRRPKRTRMNRITSTLVAIDLQTVSEYTRAVASTPDSRVFAASNLVPRDLLTTVHP